MKKRSHTLALLHSFTSHLFFFENGNALSAGKGATAERAFRLQERSSSAKTPWLFVGRRRHICRGRSWPAIPIHPRSSVNRARLYRVIGWHGEQRRRWFLSYDTSDRISRHAESRIALYRLNHNLQLWRIPAFVRHHDRLGVSSLPRWDRSRKPRALRAYAINRLHAQVFLLQRSVGDFRLHP